MLLLFPTPAVFLGAFVMQQHGLKSAIWGQNILVWALCSILFLAYARTARIFFPPTGMRLPLSVLLLLCATALIALPFLFDGLHGVHRWLVIGGIRLHPASFAIPLFLIFFRSAEREAGFRLVWTLAFTLSALLIAQPDAAEATGFILAALLLIIKRARTHVTPRLVTLFGSVLLICAWLRPDPLGPVPHVEGIIGLATAQSPLLGLLAIASLALALSPFLRISTHNLNPDHRATTLALGLYFIGKLLATLTGAFPVPLLGYSASEIIGYFLALTSIRTQPAELTSQN